MLVLIRYLPESSALKTAMREGDWPLQAHLTVGALNEIKAMRGDLWALIGHEHLPFTPVLSPSATRVRDRKRSISRAVHDDISARLHGHKRD